VALAASVVSAVVEEDELRSLLRARTSEWAQGGDFQQAFRPKYCASGDVGSLCDRLVCTCKTGASCGPDLHCHAPGIYKSTCSVMQQCGANTYCSLFSCACSNAAGCPAATPYCVNGDCFPCNVEGTGQCPGGQKCIWKPGSYWQCINTKSAGSSCSTNSECTSNSCQSTGGIFSGSTCKACNTAWDYTADMLLKACGANTVCDYNYNCKAKTSVKVGDYCYSDAQCDRQPRAAGATPLRCMAGSTVFNHHTCQPDDGTCEQGTDCLDQTKSACCDSPTGLGAVGFGPATCTALTDTLPYDTATINAQLKVSDSLSNPPWWSDAPAIASPPPCTRYRKTNQRTMADAGLRVCCR